MKIGLNKSNCAVAVSAVAALIGVIVYIVTSTTGYLAASDMNVVPVVATAVAIAGMMILFLKEDKINSYAADLTLVVTVILLLVGFYQFVIGRVTLAADVYFIPVNYPASEEVALHISIVGVACYLIAVIAMIVKAFAKNRAEA